MKLILLQPPIQDFYHTKVRIQPIGLCYLKSAVNKYLPEVRVVVKDYHSEGGRRSLAIPKELSYLKEYYKGPDNSPFSTFHQYYHFGASFEEAASDVAGENPDFVGISCLFSPYHREALKCAEEIKKKIQVPIVVGGAHASCMPGELLKHPSIDFVIRGEGEKPLVKLWKALQNGKNLETVPNLGFKKQGRIILNPMQENFPIGRIPLPDFSDLGKDRYLFEKKPMCFMIGSRGCPYKCRFCSIHLCFGRNYRKRTAENIFEEIRHRYKEGYRVFDFEDDNLAQDPEEFKRLCTFLIKEPFPEDIRLLAMNGICYWNLDPEILSLMKKAGFTDLNLSLVSTNEALLKKVQRPFNTEKYSAIVKEAFRLGFKIVSYQILGLPGEDISSMIQTLVFNSRLPVLLGASPFYLTPGSEISRDFPLKEEDVFRSRLTAMGIETDDFTREDIYTLFVSTRILNFLKGIKIYEQTTGLNGALKRARAIGKREELGAELLEKLLQEKQLYAFVKNRLIPLPRFKYPVFRELWNRLETIATQQGKRINI